MVCLAFQTACPGEGDQQPGQGAEEARLDDQEPLQVGKPLQQSHLRDMQHRLRITTGDIA